MDNLSPGTGTANVRAIDLEIGITDEDGIADNSYKGIGIVNRDKRVDNPGLSISITNRDKRVGNQTTASNKTCIFLFALY